MTVDRLPKTGYDFIFEEEIYESADAVNHAIDYGQKFISKHQVFLGGFESAAEELKTIQNLVIVANGNSKIASDYGAFIMKSLKTFNTVKVFDGYDIKSGDLERLKFGGYCTVTQSGESSYLIDSLKVAKSLDLTCFNIVNVEDSPIT